MRSQHLKHSSPTHPPSLRVSSSSESHTPSSGVDESYKESSFKRKKRRRNKIIHEPLITGVAVQAASPSPSMDSVLHHFCDDAGKPSGTHSSVSMLQELVPLISSDPFITPIQDGQQYPFDQLDEALKNLDASGYQPTFEEGHQDLFYVLESIVSTKKFYRHLLLYRGEHAQKPINALQWFLCVHPSLEGLLKRKFMQALLRLSKRAKLFPESFSLTGVEIGEVVIQTPSIDIFRGLYGGREVCLKKYRVLRQSQSNAIREDLVELLIRETIIWYNHRHPNLLPFEGIFQTDSDFGKVYLVSPFLANGTTVEYLKRYPNVERRLLLLDVLSGLSYLHRNNIVHGDIKGANVLVDSEGRACLADLGLSRLTDAEILTWTSIQSTIPPWGSLLWLAPELMSAQLQYQEHFPSPTTYSDIYAFGCLAYEESCTTTYLPTSSLVLTLLQIFTGLLPFAELSTHGRKYSWQIHGMILTEVVKRGRRPLKPAVDSPAYLCYGLTDGIWDMMEKCWDREVRRRPSADELSKLPFLVDVLDDRLAQE